MEHFRKGKAGLANLLSEGTVLMHPHVYGELACGNLKKREEILLGLATLPPAKVATDSEVSLLVQKRLLWRRGLGWVDVHLLASALLSQCTLWTLDKRLEKAALELGVG